MRRQPLSAFRCVALCALALALAACAGSTTTSTSAFTGVEREAAETIANLQSNASSSEPKKICAQDLAAPLVARLGGTKGCEAALKSQLDQVDNLEVVVASVHVGTGGKTASATVRSVHEGKSATSTLALVKEGGKWRVSGL